MNIMHSSRLSVGYDWENEVAKLVISFIYFKEPSQRETERREKEKHTDREIWQQCIVISVLEVRNGPLIWSSGDALGAELTLISLFFAVFEVNFS